MTRTFALAVAASLSWALLLGSLVSPQASAQTQVQFEQARKKMVEEVVIGSGVKDERVVKAMLATRRHEFVDIQYRREAYLDKAIPIGDKQTISSPFIVSYMTQSLDPKPTDKVLEIGTGSGYQAAVLSPLVKEVYSIEIVEALGKKAAVVLKKLRYDNVHTKVGDGFLGWKEHAPFDKIIVTCSPEKVPDPLVEQLKEGGLMVVPVGKRYEQTLYLFRKKDGKLEAEALLPTLFVPMTGKAEDVRKVKPDPENPSLANGSFEEKAFPSGAQPGWYYEKHVKWETDAQAPDGEHYVSFTNDEPGVSAHLLQGFGIDGRKVKQLKVSAQIKTKDAARGTDDNEKCYILFTLYDDQRRDLGMQVMGPFLGTSDWHEESKTFDIPANAREGIFRIGLFGGTGTAAFDKISLKKVEGKK
ncbi:MAG: protein-L-isoaspartate(D-aspartate) O-methyltransferase [Pirellulaceae bacterium]